MEKIREQQLYILMELRRLNTNHTAILDDTFYKGLLKKMSFEQYRPSITLLEKENFIKYVKFFTGDICRRIYITDEGLVYLEREEVKIETEKIELAILKITHKKLKNEWWKIPLFAFGGFIIGTTTPLLVEWLRKLLQI